jgi:hypothetical protein
MANMNVGLREAPQGYRQDSILLQSRNLKHRHIRNLACRMQKKSLFAQGLGRHQQWGDLLRHRRLEAYMAVKAWILAALA